MAGIGERIFRHLPGRIRRVFSWILSWWPWRKGTGSVVSRGSTPAIDQTSPVEVIQEAQNKEHEESPQHINETADPPAPVPKPKPEWEEKKAYYLSLPFEEKRGHYNVFNTLNEVFTWSQYCTENTNWLTSLVKDTPRGNGPYEICSDLNDKVSIWKGDITTLEVDAIVNAANKSLLGGGGVDGAIHRAAGHNLKDECRTLRGCDTGDAKITAGYMLPAKYVIHTVGPMGEGATDLQSCYSTSLNLMLENDLRSIAFPCISTGIYGYPNEHAATIALETVRGFLDEHSSKVDRIIFCLFLPVDVEIYERRMQFFFPVKDVPQESPMKDDDSPAEPAGASEEETTTLIETVEVYQENAGKVDIQETGANENQTDRESKETEEDQPVQQSQEQLPQVPESDTQDEEKQQTETCPEIKPSEPNPEEQHQEEICETPKVQESESSVETSEAAVETCQEQSVDLLSESPPVTVETSQEEIYDDQTTAAQIEAEEAVVETSQSVEKIKTSEDDEIEVIAEIQHNIEDHDVPQLHEQVEKDTTTPAEPLDVNEHASHSESPTQNDQPDDEAPQREVSQENNNFTDKIEKVDEAQEEDGKSEPEPEEQVIINVPDTQTSQEEIEQFHQVCPEESSANVAPVPVDEQEGNKEHVNGDHPGEKENEEPEVENREPEQQIQEIQDQKFPETSAPSSEEPATSEHKNADLDTYY